MMRYSSSASVLALLSLTSISLADALQYQACPLLRAYYPAPTIAKDSDEVKSFTQEFTLLFDQLIATGGSDDFGEITPNTTSFSVVLFSGVDDENTDPVFFEYHHVAPEAPANATLGPDTVFPLGTLSQLFTVYAWLVEAGDAQWGTPITDFLPELKRNSSAASAANWTDITIGALAGHMSGLARDSFACRLDQPCDREIFVEMVSSQAPLFLPDTTPVISNAAFQLLAFALEARRGNQTLFSDIISSSVFEPLNMTNSALLSSAATQSVFAQDLNSSAVGDPGALSVLSTANDLARAGSAMLASRLVSPAATRRWLHPVADTSNLRNGVGRPWEIYRAGRAAAAPILDIFTKSGSVGRYASYFGLAPDFNAGFAILAHDGTVAQRGGGPDLNVYADVVSLAVARMQNLAAAEMAARYAGSFDGPAGSAIFNVAADGPGLVVSALNKGDVDVRARVAEAAGIELDHLDFRLYPSNVATDTRHQFVAVFQDRSAPVDMGTPTCITWQDVASLGRDVDVRFTFEMDEAGRAENVSLAGGGLVLGRHAE